MKYFFRLLFIASLAISLSACTDLLAPDSSNADNVPFTVSFSMANRAPQTKSKVSGIEEVVQSMQLVCFDANGQYLGIRDAEVTSNGPTPTNAPAPHFSDKGVIQGTVPQGTARIHFIANRNLSLSLSHNVGTAESVVMNSLDLSTKYDDKTFGEGSNAHQKVCYWGYHKESTAEAMSAWLKPAEGSDHVVYMIRDRAKVVLQYDATGATVPVTKIDWLIHNGRDRGYLAPAQVYWWDDENHKEKYCSYSDKEGHTNELVSIAGMNEYKNSGRYSLWTSETVNDDGNFDTTYDVSVGTTEQEHNLKIPQFLFDDDNTAADDLKVILKVTYTVDNNPLTRYHVLRLNKDKVSVPEGADLLYDIVRNNTYYINCKLLKPDVASYTTLKDAVEGEQFVNAETEVDRTIPDINDKNYTLQIKLPNEGTSIVLNSEGEHTMDFVFRLVDDINTTPEGIVDVDENNNYIVNDNIFEVKWEKTQTFCSASLPLTYNPTTKQFTITATVLENKLTDHLQDEWIVVKHKASGLTRYIHVYVIDQFRYKIKPTLTAAGNDYVLSFQLPPMKHTQFLADGSPDPDELIYPESLYPIDVKFTTNTLNAYGISQSVPSYGLFGVSVEDTQKLCVKANFENGYGGKDEDTHPISSINIGDITHWYYQQETNYWDFWYTYSLKTYPINGEGTEDDGVVNIYFKDVRDHIKYVPQNQNNGKVRDVGLFLYVEYFGKNYSVPVTTSNP